MHEASIPSRTADGVTYSGIGPELKVRVKVCDPQFPGEERCQAFPPGSTSNFKPYGLLQEFGYAKAASEAARAEFGLITGSYDNYHTTVNNVQQVTGKAGALRKNIGDLEDEINRAAGVFCHSSASGCPATLPVPDGRPTGVGAIKAFDSMLLYGRVPRDYPNDAAWLNPLGEMLVQALQYYANSPPVPAVPAPATPAPNDMPNDRSVGMPVAARSDPLANSDARARYGNAVCRPLNILAISSSTLSYDERANSAFIDLPGAAVGIDSFVNAIGDAEGITGSRRSVGAVSGNDDKSCSAKHVSRLSDVRGICPEAPTMKGSYHVAGAALYGNTNQIRTLTSPPADLAKVENALKVKTMAISLSGGVPRIDVPVPANPRDVRIPANPLTPLTPLSPPKYVSITPESMSVFVRGEVNSPLTFASISSSPTHGAFIVTWNDILLAANYDMDITGFIRYDLRPNPNSPSGWDITIRTDIPNVCGGAGGTHGFSIIGVERNGVSANGRYLTHQHGHDLDRGTQILGNMPPISQYRCGDPAYRSRIFVDPDGNRIRDSAGNPRTYADTVCYVTGNGNPGVPGQPNRHPYCTVQNLDFLHEETFQMTGEADTIIKEPLWYAAKYGSFKSSVKNPDGTYRALAMPADQDSWDSIRTDGSLGSDGIPDGYFLARRPELLEAQLRKALDVVAENSNSAPAIASAQLASDDYKYVVKFDSATVSGTLEAYKADSEGRFSVTPAWEAGARLGARVSERVIITNSGNGPAAGVKFRWNDLPAGYKARLTTNSTNRLSAANAELALAYIRGDRTKEDINGLRLRNAALLGPVVNGVPWIQGGAGSTLSGIRADGYGEFFTRYKNRDKLLWVAANDGMLHAFNPTSGDEVFAYVPGALANRLAEIPLQRSVAGRTKLNRANFVTGEERKPAGTVWPYVDGSPFSADVKVGSDWKTYVFGTLGRGGKGIFALDSTRIADLTETNAATIFKWQFTSDDDENLGYVTGDVSIHPSSSQALPVVKMNNGKYALLLGNGNKSRSGKAVLYVLDVDGPNGSNWTGRYKAIVADAGSGNGLSAPRWEDIDGNGTADVAYAGDLKGNLWKFDLASSNRDDWNVAFRAGNVNRPLYKAGHVNAAGQETALPITTAPQLLYMGKGGLMVNFATGNAFETEDFPRPGVVQRVYGIWDRPGLGSTTGRALPTGLGSLLARRHTRNAAGVVTIAADSAGTLDWSRHDGWYMDLPGSSEMVLSDPYLNAGIMTFVTVRPKDTAATDCSSTPRAALYTVDPISGQAERNPQGSIMVSNLKVAVTAKEIGDQKVRMVDDKTKKPFSRACRDGEPGCTCADGAGCSRDAVCSPGQRAKRVIGHNADAILCTSSTPRLQWREIPGLRTDQ